MSDSFEFNLRSPLTQEDWNKITDAEYENTTSITLRTPQGRRVRYVKLDVLDKIRAEIVEEAKCTMNENRAEGLYKALQIIDKAESEVSE